MVGLFLIYPIYIKQQWIWLDCAVMQSVQSLRCSKKAVCHLCHSLISFVSLYLKWCRSLEPSLFSEITLKMWNKYQAEHIDILLHSDWLLCCNEWQMCSDLCHAISLIDLGYLPRTENCCDINTSGNDNH